MSHSHQQKLQYKFALISYIYQLIPAIRVSYAFSRVTSYLHREDPRIAEPEDSSAHLSQTPAMAQTLESARSFPSGFTFSLAA